MIGTAALLRRPDGDLDLFIDMLFTSIMLPAAGSFRQKWVLVPGARRFSTLKVHIVPSSENPTGAGEPGVPPIAPAQICQQLKDPRQNGDKSLAQIIKHVTSDKLVMWAWSPGEGRTTPPMGHDEFAQKMAEWARYGAVCPK